MSDTKLSTFWGNSGHATGPSPEEYYAKLQELTKQLQRCTADLARAQQHLDSFSAISATTEQVSPRQYRALPELGDECGGSL